MGLALTKATISTYEFKGLLNWMNRWQKMDVPSVFVENGRDVALKKHRP